MHRLRIDSRAAKSMLHTFVPSNVRRIPATRRLRASMIITTGRELLLDLAQDTLLLVFLAMFGGGVCVGGDVAGGLVFVTDAVARDSGGSC